MDNKTKKCVLFTCLFACIVFIVFTKGIMQTAANFKLPIKSVDNGICMA